MQCSIQYFETRLYCSKCAFSFILCISSVLVSNCYSHHVRVCGVHLNREYGINPDEVRDYTIQPVTRPSDTSGRQQQQLSQRVATAAAVPVPNPQPRSTVRVVAAVFWFRACITLCALLCCSRSCVVLALQRLNLWEWN